MIRIGKMFDQRFALGGPKYGNQIETIRAIVGSGMSKKIMGGIFNPSPLRNRNHLRDILPIVTGAGFHFHKDERFSIRADQINLPTTAAIICCQDAETLGFEVSSRYTLSTFTQREVSVGCFRGVTPPS